MKAKKIYTCGTTYLHDIDSTNGGNLSFYTSIKALKNNQKCWKECGIIEVIIKTTKYIVKPQTE